MQKVSKPITAPSNGDGDGMADSRGTAMAQARVDKHAAFRARMQGDCNGGR